MVSKKGPGASEGAAGQAQTGRPGRTIKQGRREVDMTNIYPRPDGTYLVQVSLGRNMDGRYDKFSRVCGSVDEAVRERDQAKAKKVLGQTGTNSRERVSEYLARWLDETRDQVEPNTWGGYEQYVRLYLAPGIGHYPLSQLKPVHLQDLYHHLRHKRARPLSARTIGHVHAIVHSALGRAVALELIQRNPAEAAKPPRVDGTEEPVMLTEEQIFQLLRHATTHRLFALFVLAVTTGLRPGESRGLRWQDIDWDHQICFIRQTVKKDTDRKSLVFRSRAKTARSKRPITLPRVLLDTLADHRRRQEAERAKAGQFWVEQGLVFTNLTGHPLRDHNVTQPLYRILRRASLPKVTFYQLRHQHATMLLELGWQERVAMDRLGHTNVAMTHHYQHVPAQLQREVAESVDALFRRIHTAEQPPLH